MRKGSESDKLDVVRLIMSPVLCDDSNTSGRGGFS